MLQKKILVVDDEEDINMLLCELLRSREYGVDNAFTGEEALQKAQHHPDLILLDRNLPDTDGLEVCRKVRQDNRLKNIPIIMLTARDKPSEKIEGLYIGADDYITKPFDREELIARIGAALRRTDFTDRMKEDNAELLAELKKILDRKLITPFFQPIFSLESLKPIGFEALSRPPAESLLSNPEFLFRAALNLGVYFELEMMCWEKAITTWKEAGAPEKLFLNCSPYLIEHSKFDDVILSKMDIDPHSVALELTERMAIVDYRLFLDRVRSFKKSAIGITVDDVGCGFASLDTIAEIKPEYVKIDISLVRNINGDGVRQNIVEAVVAFCEKSNIAAIAEGIETEEEFRALLELGAHAGQGYWLARPLPEVKTDGIVRL